MNPDNEYRKNTLPPKRPYSPPTIMPPQEELPRKPNLSQIYKTPVIEVNPYGSAPYSYPVSAYPQVYFEYEP